MKYEPKTVDKVVLAFGPARWLDLAPPIDDIPPEFLKHRNTRWNKIVANWFFSGMKDATFIPKPGIDAEVAYHHVLAMMRSYEPKHEHKEAACAYLLSLWFDDIKL